MSGVPGVVNVWVAMLTPAPKVCRSGFCAVPSPQLTTHCVIASGTTDVALKLIVYGVPTVVLDAPVRAMIGAV